MTELLEKAFVEAAKLTAEKQDALATWILEELASEEKWKKVFATTQGLVEQLADEALAEYEAGQTQELDLEEL